MTHAMGKLLVRPFNVISIAHFRLYCRLHIRTIETFVKVHELDSIGQEIAKEISILDLGLFSVKHLLD
jgi:hypothetical protein